MTTGKKAQCREYEAKRTEWTRWLDGDDRHSVMNQITRMIWDAAIFRVINEARRLAPKDLEGGVQLNGMIHDLINRGFFVGQANAIRRLTDKSLAAGSRGVYSLHGLLEDMEKHAHLITREHIFAAEGLAYDGKPVREAFEEYCQQQERAGNGGCGVPNSLDWLRVDERHRQIDRLAGVAKNKRSRKDAVRPECFGRLKKKLDVCGKLSAYVDKFIAHAATPGSRALVKADELNITLGNLWEAHEAVCTVANFVDVYLLTGTSHGFLAVPQYNQFKYIDQPLIAKEVVARLHEVWHEYDLETHKWAAWGMAQFEAGKP